MEEKIGKSKGKKLDQSQVTFTFAVHEHEQISLFHFAKGSLLIHP